MKIFKTISKFGIKAQLNAKPKQSISHKGEQLMKMEIQDKLNTILLEQIYDINAHIEF